MPTPLNLTYILPYDCPCFARMRNSFSSVDLSTVDLSTCRPVTWLYMPLYGVCILLRGVWGACTQAFRCESMPTPLNLTYILPYDCACFARMHNSFTSVNLSTVYLLTCLPVSLSTCRPVNILLAITCAGCPVLLFFLFFPIFSGLPIFSYILIPNPIFFHQIPIFFKMLQILMKYQGKIMEFWFEMPVLMSLAFIFFLARS